MNCNSVLNITSLSEDPHTATKFLVDLVFNKIWPLIKEIRKKFQSTEPDKNEEELSKKLNEVFTVCCRQLNKCVCNLFHVFKLENKHKLHLHEIRQCTIERLSWCMSRLQQIDLKLTSKCDEADASFLATPMYFVTWIDNTFEILSKLSEIVYRTEYKDTEDLYEIWKGEVVEIVSDLHLSLDELLLSAMTLCKNCLPSDQHIVRARCQVVLRESKNLLSEIISNDLDTPQKITKESLKLPIKPSNINVLIDVLKDVLYALETNTNTALLALVVHCFCQNVCPVLKVKKHYEGTDKGRCSCLTANEECLVVEEFDMHNERLMQIGTFAMSCSSDQRRISILRSGLASLEALEPHLVPALALSPRSLHSRLLVTSWREEVQEIRDSVFLIVDPAAFADKSKQMMHEQLLKIMQWKANEEEAICAFANIGSVVLEFFNVYNQQEPEALLHQDKLIPLIEDFNKALNEVKVVINLFYEGKVLYEVKMPKNRKDVTHEQVLKRLKLLYTLVSRINGLFHPKDNDDQLFEVCEPKDVTNVIPNPIIGATYVNSPKKDANVSRSIFARTTNIRTPTSKCVLNKLTQHLNTKRNGHFSFSIQLDEMFSLDMNSGKNVVNKQFNNMKEVSVLYHTPMKNKSLRKAVLSKHCKMPFETPKKITECVDSINEEDFIDDTTSLQITEILDQMNDMTRIVNKTQGTLASNKKTQANPVKNNVLKIDINKDYSMVSKRIWNIPVNTTTVEMCLDGSIEKSVVSNSSSQRSDVTTQERIDDLNLVETRLSKLKMQQETSL